MPRTDGQQLELLNLPANFTSSAMKARSPEHLEHVESSLLDRFETPPSQERRAAAEMTGIYSVSKWRWLQEDCGPLCMCVESTNLSYPVLCQVPSLLHSLVRPVPVEDPF